MATSFGGSTLRRWEGGRSELRVNLVRQFICCLPDVMFLALVRISRSMLGRAFLAREVCCLAVFEACLDWSNFSLLASPQQHSCTLQRCESLQRHEKTRFAKHGVHNEQRRAAVPARRHQLRPSPRRHRRQHFRKRCGGDREPSHEHGLAAQAGDECCSGNDFRWELNHHGRC